MTHSKETPEKESVAGLSHDFREQALEIIRAGLEGARAQHPLDIPDVFEHDRPSLGGGVPISLFRAVRLLGFREVVGSRISAAILSVSGRSVARKLGIKSVEQLTDALRDFSIARLVDVERQNGHIAISATECATCSGLPNIGEPICHFETGFIAGGLEEVLGGPVTAQETKCWGLGDRICRWEASLDTSDGEGLDNLELIMTLAGQASQTMEHDVVLRRKNRELRKAYHQLRDLEHLKSDLTDMVAHDMRAPLTVAIGAVESLAELLEPEMPENQRHLLNLAMSSGQTLMNMINDLLDVSKLEDGKLRLRKSESTIGTLMDQAVAQVGVLAQRKRLSLSASIADGIPELRVDVDRMVRVLVNLLTNAVHHTSPGGSIEAVAGCDADRQAVTVSIRDTGEGIPSEYLDRIFDKFVQVESYQSRKRYSTGLGLTFCKLMIEAHGGRIWAESEPGNGSTFNLMIPAG